MKVQAVGVIGAGLMGSGIAQVAAESGYKVVLRDIDLQYVDRGLKSISKNLNRDVEKGRRTREEAEAVLKRLTGTTEMEALSGCDFVIEAAVEKIDLKKAIFRELGAICKPGVMLASNTSGLSITEIAASSNRPAKVIGMHFFNPVPVMKLVELIKGAETDQETVDTAAVLVESFGKEAIFVQEAPLFAVNRILVPMLNEAMFVLMEGIASAEDIDKGMRLGANHPIGPLALSDLVGLDTLLFVSETLYQETGDSKYRPCPLLRKLVRAGHLGRKSGRGFYIY
ncbi:MAG: 3-hydroxybutyryl-CoA dehydrogenase [Peptococcaceae bacterium BICA1-7]|nr:MAG: 3-hydroxybutyryl-CoA dehydrogenase [Peptococcaceae bacterium BICA1-7]HBV95862.1 3-hydroxybutyryl-CoA dehydrogenase [Desulfotomaculum sp.]